MMVVSRAAHARLVRVLAERQGQTAEMEQGQGRKLGQELELELD